MKVVHYIASIDKKDGGTSAYMKLLALELKNKVDLIIATGISPEPLVLDGVKVKFFKTNLSYLFFLEKDFKEFLEIETPDLVHINGIWTPDNWLFHKVAIKLGIKVVLSPHGMLEPYILNRNSLKKKIALLLYQDKAVKSAEYLHTTSKLELENIRDIGYHQKAIIIPNGIDISEVKPKSNWTKNEKINILFLSRVHPKKGIETLIDAVAELKYDDLIINIAGEGDDDYISKLKKQAAKRSVSHLINFVGGVYGNDKWLLYKKSDLFVLPTFSENFGIVVAEALATGIPVITTKGTPWHELKTKGCGWWIDLSINNLKEALRDAIGKSQKELEEMGKRGIQLVKEKYDIKAVSHAMKDFYSTVLKNTL